MFPGFGEAVPQQFDGGQTLMCIRVLRIDDERPSVALRGLLDPTEVAQSDCEIVVCIGAVGPQPQRAVEDFHSFLKKLKHFWRSVSRVASMRCQGDERDAKVIERPGKSARNFSAAR